MIAPSIWDTVRAAEPRSGKTIAERYAEWRATEAGQQVFREAVDMAMRARNAGIDHYGIGAICEVIRWRRAIRGRDAEGFKVNNNYRALLAREIMAARRDLDGFFEIRQRLVE
jgi:hypothetical protein